MQSTVCCAGNKGMCYQGNNFNIETLLGWIVNVLKECYLHYNFKRGVIRMLPPAYQNRKEIINNIISWSTNTARS